MNALLGRDKRRFSHSFETCLLTRFTRPQPDHGYSILYHLMGRESLRATRKDGTEYAYSFAKCSPSPLFLFYISFIQFPPQNGEQPCQFSCYTCYSVQHHDDLITDRPCAPYQPSLLILLIRSTIGGSVWIKQKSTAAHGPWIILRSTRGPWILTIANVVVINRQFKILPCAFRSVPPPGPRGRLA